VRNDETFLLIDDADVHAAFVDNFDRIWADPSMAPGCAKAGTGVDESEQEVAAGRWVRGA